MLTACGLVAGGCTSVAANPYNITCLTDADCGDTSLCVAGLCRDDLACVPGETSLCTCADGRLGGTTCDPAGLSQTPCDCSCAPACAGRLCGSDARCNVVCGRCNRDQQCQSDTGQCAGGCLSGCAGRQCGPDPSACLASCGSCSPDQTCDANGQCKGGACEPDCSQMVCGLDPRCSQSCGTCAGTQQCDLGVCTGCDKDCSGMTCGLDPKCSMSCGSCADGYVCEVGHCTCVPNCAGRVCGPDPRCGVSCGGCNSDQMCTAAGQCVCAPTCGTRECGPDPRCGTSCGTCSGIKRCSTGGSCYTPTTCSFTISPAAGNQNTDFYAYTSTNGSNCAVSFDGQTPMAFACSNNPKVFKGFEVAGHTPGYKLITFYVGAGPNGAVSCTAPITVTDSLWCRTWWESAFTGTQLSQYRVAWDSNGSSCTRRFSAGDWTAAAAVSCGPAAIDYLGRNVAGHDSFSPAAGTNTYTFFLQATSTRFAGAADCQPTFAVTNVPWCTLTLSPQSFRATTPVTYELDNNGIVSAGSSNCTYDWTVDDGTGNVVVVGTPNGPYECGHIGPVSGVGTDFPVGSNVFTLHVNTSTAGSGTSCTINFTRTN
ncbi:MAG: hypothetical protein HY903_19070 [Deltaproteobacteria bacterium]|nr:hypothetical protein [Deltaproteobacteria bacterium]